MTELAFAIYLEVMRRRWFRGDYRATRHALSHHRYLVIA